VGFELFERAAGAKAQLLRVQRLGEAGREGSAAGFELTFDVGRILVRSDPMRGCLQIEESSGDPGGLTSAGEEEPWWRVLGNPIVAAANAGNGVMRLQFRPDEENPRVVVFSMEDGLVRAVVER
jgi:hypothetical protein